MSRSQFAMLCAMLIVLIWGATATANSVLKLEGYDPESYFEADDDDSLDLSLENTFTIEAWVNPSVLEGGTFDEYIVVSKEDAYEIGVNNGNIFKTAIRPMGQGWEWWSSDEEVVADDWTHLAVTYDGEFISLFHNGKLTISYSKPGDAINDSPDTFKIGRRTRGGDSHGIFEGLVDEVRLSNVIRYTADFTPKKECFTPDANTMALYHFDEQTNGVVKDASTYQNDGRLLNDATLVADDFLSCGAVLLGDFDNNGKLEVADVNQLSRAIGKQSTDVKYDVTGDGKVTDADLTKWVKDLRKTWVGDANVDGEFNSADFVSVFQAGRFEGDVDATWSEGDWNADLRFNSGDFVAAFQDGGFEAGPRPSVAAVPEPSCGVLLSLAGLLLLPRARP